MGWQEFMIIAVLVLLIAQSGYLMWKIISRRNASYWWFLLMLFGWLLGPILGYFFIPKPKAAPPMLC
ncbi:MAG: hypothetical protein EXR68_01920 [Dehalococcoidia bacterium]|nr:hypothetical protein [Dehalococcoidia bacterium]